MTNALKQAFCGRLPLFAPVFRAGAAASLLCLAVHGSGQGQPQQRPPAHPSAFMMGTHHLDSPPDRSDAIRARLVEANLGGFRDEIPWSATEITTGSYTFCPNRDHSIREAARLGLRPLLIFDYSNSLYDGGLPPKSPEGRMAFAHYAVQLMKRYGDTVRDWEIWNEPNGEGFWPPKPSPKDYAELLKAVYPVVKKADPGATIGGMVTSGIDQSFIQGVLENGAARAMDVVSVHPYRYPRAPEEIPSLSQELEELRRLLQKYGAPTRIWITEMGYPTHKGETGVTLQEQAALLARSYLIALSVPGVERFYWYDFINDGTQPAYNEHNFGVLYPDLSPKPAYVALSHLARELGGSKFRGRLGDGKAGRYAQLWSGPAGHTVAAWSIGAPATLLIESRSQPLRMCDLAGTAPRHLQPGAHIVAASELPVLVSANATAPSTRLIGPPIVVRPDRICAGETTSATIEVNRELHDWISRSIPGAKPLLKFPNTGPVRVASNATAPGQAVFSMQPASMPVSIVADTGLSTGVRHVKMLLDTGQPQEPPVFELPMTIVEPVGLRVGPAVREGKHCVRIDVASRSARGRNLVVEARHADTDSELAPPAPIRLESAASLTHYVDAGGKASATPMPVRVSVRENGQPIATATRTVCFLVIPRMATPPKPDSRLDDWNGIGPAVDITTASLHGDPIRASVRLAWSRAGLHLAVQAHDVKHCQQYSGRMMWAEDSIQLAFDADPLRPSPRGIFEFGLCGIGSRATLSPRLFAYHTPDGAGCGPRREPAAVRREAATTVYELTLPWPSLGVKEPQAGQVFGLSLLVNDADAPGGREFAAWFGGIATHKDPDRFGFVVLGQSNETGESPR